MSAVQEAVTRVLRGVDEVVLEMLDDALDGIPSASVVFSAQRTYRYLLTRQGPTWPQDVPPLTMVMLNPSTASAVDDDPTVRRCVALARRAGAGGLVVVNLFSLRATDPNQLLAHPDPVGEHNDVFLREMTALGGPVVAGWGAHPAAALKDRAGQVARLIPEAVPLLCQGTTQSGHPRHPLYLSNATPLQRWPRPMSGAR